MKKFISLFLCLVLVFSFGFVGCGKLSAVNQTVTLNPIGIDGDKALWSNPDRGFRTEWVIYIEKTRGNKNYDTRTVFVDESEDSIRRSIQKIFDIYNAVGTEQTNLALCYFYITEWRDEELSDDLLRFFDIYFQMCREKKWKNMLRICYCNSHEDITTGASESWMIRHIKQLESTGVIARNADTIHTIECGFIGAYGEMGEIYQHPPINDVNVIKAINERLAVPNNLYYSVRRPMYKNLVDKSYEHYWNISYNCDAMFGYQSYGWKEFEAGTDEWKQIENEGAYTPQGGEMLVNASTVGTGCVPTGMEMIKQCYFHHHTSMSFWHGYREVMNQDNVMTRWMKQEITPKLLEAEGIIYDPAWFLDENGAAVKRNCYEFIRDHLGYKITAKTASLNWSANESEKMKVNMSFVNYGFAAAFNLESGFAILDSEGKVVSEVKAGDPEKWYNRDPEKPFSVELLNHELSAELDAPTEKGTYRLAFYLRNTMQDYANLSNTCENVNGYNVLCSFEI